MNKFAVVSDAVPLICKKLINLGFKLIYTDSVDGFISYEQKHADMQCCIIDDRAFVLSSSNNLFESLKKLGYDVVYTKSKHSGTYPNNILLNTKVVGKYLIGKIDNLDSELLDYCKMKEYTPINVNQGYCACSILKITDNAIITADNSICKALKDTEIDVLKISEGYIDLHGAGKNTFGFIGGASVNLDDNTILFFGDVKKHPDYVKIKEFCAKYNVDIDYINDISLTDIGSAVLLNN